MTDPSHAVFLSYASQDAEAARRICEALRAAGIEVWFDQSELRGGDVWDRQIRKQIHDCALFIPIISANSQSRLEGYFRREWKLAADRTHDMAEEKAFLLPVVIDDISERSAAVPDKFREVQWSRLPAGEVSPVFVQRVLRLLKLETARSAQEVRSQIPATPHLAAAPLPGSRPTAWRRGLLGIVMVAAIGVGYVAVDKFVLSRRLKIGTQTSVSAGQAGASGLSTISEKSIAVLPFVDMSEKHEQEYFADGLAEEVIDLLARLPSVHVIGRTSSFQFRGRTVDIRSIGAALGAGYVLEGSVRRSGNQMRVTAQLISTRDGTHRWSDTYDASFEDAFKVEDSIAADLARTLELTVTASDPKNSVTDQPEAYDLYLQGRQGLDSNSEEGTHKAVALFTEVVRRDPKSSRALAALATAYTRLGEEGWMPPAEAFGRARQRAQEALQLDGKNVAAHAALANIAASYDWDWQRADREIAAALNSGERSCNVLVNAAQIASAEARWDQALEYLHEGLAMDPLQADAHMVLGAWIHLRRGKYPEAEEAIRRALQIRPHWGTGRYFLAISLLMQSKLPEALKEAQSELPRDGKFQASSAVLYAMHRQADSDDALRDAIAESQSEWPVSIAKLYAYRGQSQEAFEWLDRAYTYRDEDLYWIKGDPLLKNLEGDPRYKAFLRKMNLPE